MSWRDATCCCAASTGSGGMNALRLGFVREVDDLRRVFGKRPPETDHAVPAQQHRFSSQEGVGPALNAYVGTVGALVDNKIFSMAPLETGVLSGSARFIDTYVSGLAAAERERRAIPVEFDVSIMVAHT